MITDVTLPTEIVKAALSLEDRLRLLRVPTRHVPMAEWNSIPEAVHHLIPSWIPSVLSQFSLLGSVLECRNNLEDAAWQRLFCFWGPAEYKRNLLSGDYNLNEEILSAGLVPISDEQNGDMWVTSSKDGPSSPIYLFDLSRMEKILASSGIALLMASMAVSEESFSSFGKNGKPSSVMWHPA